MLLSRVVAGALSAGVMALGASGVSGQTYPDKPIRIVTAAAGGGSDFTARLIAQGISGPLGQPLIVDNRPGGVLSAEAVAKAPPDGYTLLVTGAILWISPLMIKTPYDTVRDYSPISHLLREVYVVTVHPSMPVKSTKELLALAKAKPGQLNYSTSGMGSTSHLMTESLKSMAGIDLVHVPYKGAALAVTALIGGEVQVAMADASLVMTHVKAGKLRALAVSSAGPSALAPGVPTLAATGVPGYEAGGATGIWAPAKTPAAIIARLNQEVVRLITQPDVKEKFLTIGAEVVGSSPEQFAAMINSEIAKISKVIKDAGIKPAN